MNRLADPTIAATLTRLHRQADDNEAQVMPHVIDEAARRGATDDQGLADLLADAYLAVAPGNGELLHLLALLRPAGRIVEFGCSMGLSTIYLAASLDADEPPLITTDLEPTKIDAARDNLEKAGLTGRAEFRLGDARDTLADLHEPISLLFLDGWKGLYLPVLHKLEHRLVAGAIVIADDTQHPALAHLCAEYLTHVRAPANGYTSIALAIDDGIEISRRPT